MECKRKSTCAEQTGSLLPELTLVCPIFIGVSSARWIVSNWMKWPLPARYLTPCLPSYQQMEKKKLRTSKEFGSSVMSCIWTVRSSCEVNRYNAKEIPIIDKSDLSQCICFKWPNILPNLWHPAFSLSFQVWFSFEFDIIKPHEIIENTNYASQRMDCFC